MLSVAAVWLTAGALTAVGCAPSAPVPQTPSESVTPPSDSAAGPLAHRDTTSWTARSLVNALADAGLAVPDPLDNTATECPTVGCEQSVVTDTLRIKTFPTAEDAARHAAPRGLYRTDTIVVAFAPPLTAAERKPYMQTLDRLTE
ncbi:hypothetical protein [Mycolicibacterium hippocampi]|uniref:hypothetical protein n=1 Tax=Mycolicibacterium hippocampi TaxID=659824 RepID=UPI0035181A23